VASLDEVLLERHLDAFVAQLTMVVTRWSVIGSSRCGRPHAAAISAVTSVSVAPSASRAVR
jgi:hypothetical protein